MTVKKLFILGSLLLATSCSMFHHGKCSEGQCSRDSKSCCKGKDGKDGKQCKKGDKKCGESSQEAASESK